MTLRQKEWHSGVMKNVFKTRANFNRMRRKKRIIYNGRSAFMKVKGKSVQDVRFLTTHLPYGVVTSYIRALPNFCVNFSCVTVRKKIIIPNHW